MSLVLRRFRRRAPSTAAGGVPRDGRRVVNLLAASTCVPAALLAVACAGPERPATDAAERTVLRADLLDLETVIGAVRPTVVSLRNGRSATGSGVLIHPDGYVLTANHVVRAAPDLMVVPASGAAWLATVIASDADADLALVKIDAGERLPFARLASDSQPNVGQWIVVLGNPFGLGVTASAGIVGSTPSALGASNVSGLIQTDAAINPGNSGGPVFGLDGQVVAIATAQISLGQGLGFAIPVDRARARLLPLLPP